jgi:hypothetical protein
MTIDVKTCAALLLAVSAPLSAQQVSEFSYVRQVELRDDGWHAIYLVNPIPNPGCSLGDRAIVDPTTAGAGVLVQAALDAKRWDELVRIRIDGCVPIRPRDALTAPKLTRIDLI